jgi:FKBP-type peptidyl-prolyl cis-trans isomerase FkpA
MRKIIILLFLGICLGEGSFAQNESKKVPVKKGQKKSSGKTYKMSPTGVRYLFYKDVPGENAKQEDVVIMHMVLKTSKDTVLVNTYKQGAPFRAAVGKSLFKGSLEDAFLMVSPGDSVSFLVNSDSLRKLGAQIPPQVENGSDLLFILKIEKVLSQEQVLQEQRELEKQQREMESKQIQIDSLLIEEYVRTNKLTATRTASGLYYVVKEKGAGAQPQKGQMVEVHYTGKLLNGTKFDSSVDRGTPFTFTIGVGQVIQGWDEGIALMKVGEKGTLLIPSGLGYGPRGAGGAIPPNAVLIFDVELINIK